MKSLENTDYANMLATSADAGLWVVPRLKCLRLLAVCYIWGGANEAFVCDVRLREDILFAKKMIGVNGTNHPSPEDTETLQRLVSECGDFDRPTKPDWAVALAAEYRLALRD